MGTGRQTDGQRTAWWPMCGALLMVRINIKMEGRCGWECASLQLGRVYRSENLAANDLDA